MEHTLHTIIDAALYAADPFNAVKNILRRSGNLLHCGDTRYPLDEIERVLVIGFGKGSAPMAHAVHSLLADQITAGMVIVKYGHTLPAKTDISPITVVEAGHPVPDKNGVRHTHHLINLLANTRPTDLVIALISGGGSALLVQPVAGISLADLQSLTDRLLKAGAPITAINTVRKHLSQVKGGQLAKLTHPARTISLILSDVGGDPLDIIASGPTAPDSGTFADAITALEKYGVWDDAPSAITEYLRDGAHGLHPETPKPGNPIFERVQNQIIANNRIALDAAATAAQKHGFAVTVHPDFVEGDIHTVAQWVATHVRQLREKVDANGHPAAFLFGGEPTVTLHGDGLGGRNQELALATAQKIAGVPNVRVACFATDGNDGPTDAAGAIISGETIANAAARGLDAAVFLQNNDSYHFFEASGELLKTGATNTNVNDIVAVLVW